MRSCDSGAAVDGEAPQESSCQIQATFLFLLVFFAGTRCGCMGCRAGNGGDDYTASCQEAWREAGVGRGKEREGGLIVSILWCRACAPALHGIHTTKLRHQGNISLSARPPGLSGQELSGDSTLHVDSPRLPQSHRSAACRVRYRPSGKIICYPSPTHHAQTLVASRQCRRLCTLTAAHVQLAQGPTHQATSSWEHRHTLHSSPDARVAQLGDTARTKCHQSCWAARIRGRSETATTCGDVESQRNGAGASWQQAARQDLSSDGGNVFAIPGRRHPRHYSRWPPHAVRHRRRCSAFLLCRRPLPHKPFTVSKQQDRLRSSSVALQLLAR